MKSQEKKWSFSLKKWDKQQWLILLLLGLILLVMAIPTKKQLDRTAEGETAQSSSLLGSSYETSSQVSNPASDRIAQLLPEKAALEQQLEELLLQVEGIGQVRVMLMLEDSSDNLTSFSSQSSAVCVQGVLIAAQGGDNSVVVRNIQEAVMALFQVEAHKIKVMKMK